MNFNISQAFSTASLLITLYVIAVAVMYLAFMRQPSKSSKRTVSGT